MAELTTLARPYAKAAFEYAQAHQQLADWSAALGVLAAVSQDDTVRQLLKEPQLTSSAKAQSLIDVCGDKLNAPAQNFVRTVAENKRLELLPTIAEMYEQLKAEQEKSVEVEVTSAFTLSKEQQDKLAKALSARLSREVRLHASEDASLIGGVIIRAGDLVIDGSVRGKLAELAAACSNSILPKLVKSSRGASRNSTSPPKHETKAPSSACPTVSCASTVWPTSCTAR